MPYVAIGQVAKALESLPRFHPFFGVTYLSMKQTGVNTTTPTVWGTTQEDALLASAYRPSGAPAGKAFYVPFGRPEDDTGFWRNPKYSGGSLQSARTRQRFSEALIRVTRDQWKFAPGYVATLAAFLPTDSAGPIKLPLFDLAAWVYRDQELPGTLQEVEQKFRTDFRLSDPAEFAQLFDSALPDATQFFSPEPLDSGELLELTHGVPEGPSLGTRTEADLIGHLETWMVDQAKLTLPIGFVRKFYTALKAQRFVVLAGRPGTGKTAFVRAFHAALADFFGGAVQLVEVSIAPEFSEADVIGYERLSGGLAATELSRKVFLAGRPNDVFVVLLDEMNLAEVDYYLARLLPAFESDATVELPGTGTPSRLPSDSFLIGTVNSYIEEPTRKPLSGPVKRRSNVMEMPNFLATLITSGQRAEFEKACLGLLQQSKNRIVTRQRSGAASVLDSYRMTALESALANGSTVRSASLMGALWDVCQVCCSDTTTAPTFGVIQDVLDYVAMSADDALVALSDQIAQKVVPQLNGPARVARELLALVEGLDGGTGKFSSSTAAIASLLRSEDTASGFVTYAY